MRLTSLENVWALLVELPEKKLINPPFSKRTIPKSEFVLLLVAQTLLVLFQYKLFAIEPLL